MDRTTGPSAHRGSDHDAEGLGGIGEFGLIREVTRDLPGSPAVSVGVGDDAAVFLVNGSAVVSTDMLVEGVHFRRQWSSGHDIGRKAVAKNAADLEAMGATPVSMVVALGLPPDVSLDWVRDLSSGVREEADRVGITLVGGDTTGARDVTICITVVGQTDGVPPVLRSGARPGQVVAVRGRLGWAAAGLVALQRGFRSPRAAVESQRTPQPPYGAGRQAALAGATAMIDVSDGLVQDLGHIARASGVLVDVDPSRVPVDEPVRAVAAATGSDPLALALTGGEDHALAACFEAGDVPAGWRVVGQVRPVPEGGRPAVLVAGKEPAGPGGWDHFSR